MVRFNRILMGECAVVKDENGLQDIRYRIDRTVTTRLAKEVPLKPRASLVCIKSPLNAKFPNFDAVLTANRKRDRKPSLLF